MPKDYFGEHIARGYDDTSADMFQPAKVGPVVEFLAELATDGTALELGIGTERSEERRVGKECRLTCRSRWSPYH